MPGTHFLRILNSATTMSTSGIPFDGLICIIGDLSPRCCSEYAISAKKFLVFSA